MTDAEMAEAALAYAEGGARVLPLHSPAETPNRCTCGRRGCKHPGKHPRTLHGLADASSDLATVTRWWSMWPAANLGIRPAVGQCALDVDPRHAGDVQLAAMQARYGALPATRTARTGGGGWHLWFSCPGALRGALAPGLDIKSSTGFVVVEPSLHVSGSRYRWTNRGPIVAAPDFLRRLLVRPPTTRSGGTGELAPAALTGLARVVATAPDGTRNNTLNWACWRAALRGVDLTPLIDAAVTAGLSRDEAERTAASAERGASRAKAT